MKSSTALYQLKTFPEAFLRNNLLIIAGIGRSGVVDYFVEPKDASNQGYNEAFKFTSFSADERREQLQVHNVRMYPKTEAFNPKEIEAYSLDGGPDIMITGQLSGCAFVMAKPGATLVAHLQPGGPRGDAHELRNTVVKEGRFKGHPNVPVKVFGGGDYTAYAYVVGIRTGNDWTFYAQQVTGPGTNVQITDVRRLAN